MVLQCTYLRNRRGSCLKADDTPRIGAGPPIWGPVRICLPPSYEDEPPCSLNIRIATSGGAGTKGPKGLQEFSHSNLWIITADKLNVFFFQWRAENKRKWKPTQHQVQASRLEEDPYLREKAEWHPSLSHHKYHTWIHQDFLLPSHHLWTVDHGVESYQSYQTVHRR